MKIEARAVWSWFFLSVLFFVCGAMLGGCETSQPANGGARLDPVALQFAEVTERAHGRHAWSQQRALAADLVVTFGSLDINMGEGDR